MFFKKLGNGRNKLENEKSMHSKYDYGVSLKLISSSPILVICEDKENNLRSPVLIPS